MTNVLKLFVTGRGPVSQRAIDNLQDICDSMPEFQFELKVIDVLEDPQRAESERILATPALVRQQKEAEGGRQIVGDLSDRSKVLRALDLPQLTAVGQARQGIFVHD